MKAEAERCQKKYAELSERIDVQAAEQYGDTKHRLELAKDKLKTVENNKKVLLSTIDKLDEHKVRSTLIQLILMFSNNNQLSYLSS